MSLTGHIVGRLQNDSLAANLGTLCRFWLRALGKGGSLLGSYAVLPLDHRAGRICNRRALRLQRSARAQLYDDLIR
jgi:hypothetical protein